MKPILKAKHLRRNNALGWGCLNLMGICFLFYGCAAHGPVSPHEKLQGSVWIQKSGEYSAVALQTFNMAEKNLDQALNDPTWTAVLGQKADLPNEQLKPAVILDLDETVLDNSAFNAYLIENNMEHNPSIWGQWVMAAEARLVPGAKEFLQVVESKNVKIFYVTNRNKEGEEFTRKNLEALGLPLYENEDNLLTRYERKEWGSDKTTRRNFLAEKYRILFLVGDALGDFTSTSSLSLQEQREKSRQFKTMWSSKWYILPNPSYGRWEAPFRKPAGNKNRQDILNNKMKSLDRWDF